MYDGRPVQESKVRFTSSNCIDPCFVYGALGTSPELARFSSLDVQSSLVEAVGLHWR